MIRRRVPHRRAAAPSPLTRLWRGLLALVLAFGLVSGPAAAAPLSCGAPAGEADAVHGLAHGSAEGLTSGVAATSGPDQVAGDLGGEGLAPDAGDAEECQRDHCQHSSAPAVDVYLKGLLSPRRRRRPPPPGRGMRQAPRRLLERPPRR